MAEGVIFELALGQQSSQTLDLGFLTPSFVFFMIFVQIWIFALKKFPHPKIFPTDQIKQPPKNIILELVRHTDAVTASNGFQSNAEPYANGTRNDEGGGLLALICASLCKDTPLADSFGPQNDNVNNNSQPLMSPVQNGEQIAQDPQVDAIFCLVYTTKLWSIHRLLLLFLCWV